MDRDTKLIAILRRQYHIILTALGGNIFRISRLRPIRNYFLPTSRVFLMRPAYSTNNSWRSSCIPDYYSKEFALSMVILKIFPEYLPPQISCSKRQKMPIDLFPRVLRIDPIFFTVQYHGLSHAKMCFLLTNGVKDDKWKHLFLISEIYSDELYLLFLFFFFFPEI